MSDPEFVVMGASLSAPCRIVFTFLRVNNILYKETFKHMYDWSHKTPRFLRMNRYGQIPILFHEDVSIGESSAIIQYIAEVKGLSNNWWPGDLRERTKVVSFLHWFNSEPCPKIRSLHYRAFGGPVFHGELYTPEQVEEARRNCYESIQEIEEISGRRRCIAGTDQPSAADIVCFSIIQQNVVYLDYDLSPFPSVQEWFFRIKEIPQVQKLHEELVQAVARFK